MLLAVLLTLLALSGCEKSYKEARSSLSERRVIAHAGDYEVRYELFRALFLNYKSSVDGGDNRVWTGPEANVYFERAKALCEEAMRSIFGTFAFAKSMGIDPYSEEADRRVAEYVKATIEGGFVNGNYIEGFGGSVSDYRKSLEERHMTDAVNRLLFRYSICNTMLYEYYTDTFGGGTIQTDGDTIRAFYNSDACVRLTWIAVPKNTVLTESQSEALANAKRSDLIACATMAEKLQYVAFHNLQAAGMDKGVFMTEATCDADYKAVLTEAMTLQAGEVGQVVEAYDAFYIPLRLEKEAGYLSDTAGMNAIINLYIEHVMYTEIEEAEKALTIDYTAAFDKYADKYGSNIK